MDVIMKNEKKKKLFSELHRLRSYVDLPTETWTHIQVFLLLELGRTVSVIFVNGALKEKKQKFAVLAYITSEGGCREWGKGTQWV